LRSSRLKQWPRHKLAHAAVTGIVAALVLAFAYQLYKQNKRYIRVVRNPDIASFEQFKTALRSLVPEGVCPVVVRDPVIWLAFPEHDRCFANIQDRMKKAVDIDGSEYALIVNPKFARNWLRAIASNNHYLLGEILNSPYGSYQIYYTGVDPRWLTLEPVRYKFFGNRRGFTSDKVIPFSSEVWTISAGDYGECSELANSVTEPEGILIKQEQSKRADNFVMLCSIELKPDTVYQLLADATAEADQWSVLVLEDGTESRLVEKRISDQSASRVFEGIFRTGKIKRVMIGAMPLANGRLGPLHISRLSIREVPPSTLAE